MPVELILEVSPEQDRLFQDLIETYTREVGLLLQNGEPLNSREWDSKLKRYAIKERAISDVWLIRNCPERFIKLPSFRMNGVSYRITRENVLIFSAFVFQGIVDFKFMIQLPGDYIKEAQQGVLTLFRDERGWMVTIEPKKNTIKRKNKREREAARLKKYASSPYIII